MATDHENEIAYHTPRMVTCKMCGEQDLTWRQLPVGWRLINRNNVVHQCKHQHKRVSPAKDQTKLHCWDCSLEWVPENDFEKHLLASQLSGRDPGRHFGESGTWNTTSLLYGE